MTEAGAQAVTDFGLALFLSCLEGENPLVSPLSVLEALGMTANGAAGDTLTQMEEAFGLDTEALNSFLLAYRQGLGDGASLANGIWLNDGSNAAVKEDFLQTNADWYGAAVTSRPFDDAGRDEINAWVKDHTAGRIESILDKLDPAAVLVLVNALAFDGTWENIYREDASFMWSQEEAYLEDDHAEGFIKYYEGRDYAFAALLPEEGMSVANYAGTLTGEGLRELLANASAEPVETALPKFTASFGAELSGAPRRQCSRRSRCFRFRAARSFPGWTRRR